MNFIERIKNNSFLKGIKERPIEFFMAFATFSMAVGTFLLVLETKELKNTDTGPNISISDVELQLIDDTGTPIKDWSWQDGEKLNKSAVSKNIKSAVLALKFSNNGRTYGYLKLKNFLDIEKKLKLNTTDSERKRVEDPFLVPAGGQTGLLYGLELIYELNKDGYANIDYDFDVFDSKSSFHDHLKFLIECPVTTKADLSVQIVCYPKFNGN